MKKVVLYCLLLIIFLPGFGQSQLGLRMSNYSGVNGIQLNPAQPMHETQKWDLNIINVGAFIDNEYAYLENTSLLHLSKFEGEFARKSDETVKNNVIYFDYFDAHEPINGSIKIIASLPSFMIRMDNVSVGWFSNVRSAIGTHRLDQDFDFYRLDLWKNREEITFNRGKINGALWAETGINVGIKVFEGYDADVYLGGNVKYLMGSQSFYLYHVNQTETVLNNDSLFFSGGPLEFGFTDLEGRVNGGGLGLDLGFTYVKKEFNQDKYKWRFGASIIDIGYINFRKNAQSHLIEESDYYDISFDAYKQADNLDEALAINSEQTVGEEGMTLLSEQYTLQTPAMLSLQFDYALPFNFYFNATVNRRLDFSPYMLHRDNIWAVSARYEHRWAEVGMPVVLYNDRHLRMGTWVRLGPFTVGSDHLGSVISKQEQFTGSDIYAGFRISPIFWPFSGGKYNSRYKNDIERCFEF